MAEGLIVFGPMGILPAPVQRWPAPWQPRRFRHYMVSTNVPGPQCRFTRWAEIARLLSVWPVGMPSLRMRDCQLRPEDYFG